MQSSDAALLPIRLPAVAAAKTGYDWEHIAYLLPGSLLTLVDPGPSAAAEALLSALDARGVACSEVRQVLLTSPSAEIAANAHLFPHAVIRGGAKAGVDSLLRLHRATAAALGDEVAVLTAADALSQKQWQCWKEDHSGQQTATPWKPLDDGAMLIAGDLSLVASHRPAFSDGGVVYSALDGSLTFAGEFGVLDEDLPVGDWQAFADALAAVTQSGPPERLLPSRGRMEASGHVAFRAMALSANNLVTNLPLALARPATLVELFERDLGYWPEAIAESALRLTRLRAALEELSRAGVVYRQPGPSLLQTRYAMVPA